SFSPKDATIMIVSGSAAQVNYTGEDFGNYTPGSIKGRKFNDLDRKSEEEGRGAGLAGWIIKLDGTTLAGDAVHQMTTTASDNPNTPENELGTYSFTDLKPGTYSLSEDLAAKPGFVQSFSPKDATIMIVSGSAMQVNYTGEDFGNYTPGSIKGRKFND